MAQKARKNNAKPKLEGKSGKGSLAATNGISKSTGGRMKKSMSAPQLHLLNSAEGGALNDAGLDAASRHRHNRQVSRLFAYTGLGRKGEFGKGSHRGNCWGRCHPQCERSV